MLGRNLQVPSQEPAVCIAGQELPCLAGTSKPLARRLQCAKASLGHPIRCNPLPQAGKLSDSNGLKAPGQELPCLAGTSKPLARTFHAWQEPPSP